jgi:enamine deaminase RidA (YjgF/YER057c/UK114 family)
MMNEETGDSQMTNSTTEVQRNNESGRPKSATLLVSIICALLALTALPVGAQSAELKTEFLGSQQGFSHIAKTTIGGVTTIYIAGQVGFTEGASEPGADLGEQAEIAFTNVLRRLEQAGAGIEDLIKTTVYIKDIDPSKVGVVGAAQGKIFKRETPPVSTWVGVTGLVYPQLLIEVEATAVVAAP